jgi:hypothetical protein
MSEELKMSEELNELNKVPIVDIKKYIDIKVKKVDVIKRQAYEEAARLRDEERTLENNYPILREVAGSIETSQLINHLRDRKIDDLLDDSGI